MESKALIVFVVAVGSLLALVLYRIAVFVEESLVP